MERLLKVFFVTLTLLMTACNSKKQTDEEVKSSIEEKQAVEYVKTIAAENKKTVLICKATTGNYPYYLSDRYAQVFLSAGLNKFLSDTKMSQEEEKILVEQFRQIAKDVKKTDTKDKYIIVMAEFGSENNKNEISKYLYFFRLPFDFKDGRLPTKAGKITKEIKQQVSLIALLEKGVSLQDLKQSKETDKKILNEIKDPVLKFIIE